MGIRNLNSFLKYNCKKGIDLVDLQSLSNKRIVIDASIYLYKFKKDNLLIENLYIMITKFRQYNINVVFIFDGKADAIKEHTINKRKNDKEAAKKEYYQLEEALPYLDDKYKYFKIKLYMKFLQKQFVKVGYFDVIKVKELLDYFGIHYFDAPGEADLWCAKMVIEKYADACLSDDMDLLVFGCNEVYRNLNIYNGKIFKYNLDILMKELNLDKEEFKDICILAGTDYNKDKLSNINIKSVFLIFNNYKMNKYKVKEENYDFYLWFQKKFNFYNDYKKLYEVRNKFNLNNIIIPDNLKNIKNKEINKNNLRNLLKNKYGFIYLDEYKNKKKIF